MIHEWLRCSALGQPLELDHRLSASMVSTAGSVSASIRSWMIGAASSDGTVCSPTSTIKGGRKKLFETVNNTSDCLWKRSLPSSRARQPRARRTMWNRRIVEYTGQELEQTGWHVFHPDDRNSHWQKFRRALEFGEPWEDTFRLRRADGEYRWFHERSEPLLDRSGRLGVLISIEGRESRNDAPAQLREPHHRADPDGVG